MERSSKGKNERVDTVDEKREVIEREGRIDSEVKSGELIVSEKERTLIRYFISNTNLMSKCR